MSEQHRLNGRKEATYSSILHYIFFISFSYSTHAVPCWNQEHICTLRILVIFTSSLILRFYKDSNISGVEGSLVFITHRVHIESEWLRITEDCLTCFLNNVSYSLPPPLWYLELVGLRYVRNTYWVPENCFSKSVCKRRDSLWSSSLCSGLRTKALCQSLSLWFSSYVDVFTSREHHF